MPRVVRKVRSRRGFYVAGVPQVPAELRIVIVDPGGREPVVTTQGDGVVVTVTVDLSEP